MDLAFGILEDCLVRIFEVCIQSGRFTDLVENGQSPTIVEEGHPLGWEPSWSNLSGTWPDMDIKFSAVVLQRGFRESRYTIDTTTIDRS